MFEAFTEKAPAKINLALRVLGRRPDGYHDLDSIVAFADVGDDLRFAPAQRFDVTAEGPFAKDLPVMADNIITRTWEKLAALAAARGAVLPPVAIHLTKNLPVASGIGGGSANAAAAMRGFLKIAGIEEIDAEILALALSLGADVPACLTGRACRMQGIGERITPLAKLAPRRIVLVNPGVPVATASVFGKLGLSPGSSHGTGLADADDAAVWRNDLTAPAIAIAPVIGEVLDVLQRQPGVTGVRMSGSGATCLGFIDGEIPAGLAEIAERRGWWLAPARLAFP